MMKLQKIFYISSLFLLSVQLGACSVSHQLDDMSSSTDHMDKATSHMDKDLSDLNTKTGNLVDNVADQTANVKQMSQGITDLAQTEKTQAAGGSGQAAIGQVVGQLSTGFSQLGQKTGQVVESVNKSADGMRDLSKNVSELVQEQKDVAPTIAAAVKGAVEDAAKKVESGAGGGGQALTNFISAKKTDRARDLDSLSKATTLLKLGGAAREYVCDFEFRVWNDSMATQITQDQATAPAVAEYLSAIGDYLLKQGVSTPLNVFSEPTEQLAQLNQLVNYLKFARCPVMANAAMVCPSEPQANGMSFYKMIATAFDHEKNKQPLSDTDKIILGDGRPAVIFALQAYHNLRMGDAVKAAMIANNQDMALFAPSLQNQDNGSLKQVGADIAKLYTGFTTWAGLKHWTFDLSHADPQTIKTITMHATEAVQLVESLKDFGIKPEYDSYLVSLLKELRPADGVKMSLETTLIFNEMSNRYAPLK